MEKRISDSTKKILVYALLIFGVLGFVFWEQEWDKEEPMFPPAYVSPDTVGETAQSEGTGVEQESVAVVAERLSIPWEIVFLPDGDMLVTERPGTLIRIGRDGAVIPISGVRHVGEGGLLGLALHPDFTENKLIYLYLTTTEGSGVENRVDRYRFEGNELTERTPILGGIPGAIYHDGGRIAFGPDGYLYIATGDATREQLAQDKESLAGKILRLDEDGSIPRDNPFGTAVYSYGHRNVQGLAWDDRGNLWATEHGRSGIRSGYDELNRIERGGNYGWPTVEGDERHDGMIAPVIHSGATTTWAPSGAAYSGGSIFFSGLRGEALYEAKLDVDRIGVEELRTHLQGEYGRIRAVVAGPDGRLHLSTSNTDGRGNPQEEDDRILRVDPSS
jgi:aldose sugar dehydrogenase